MTKRCGQRANDPRDCVTKAEHDALVAPRRRPFTQDPIGIGKRPRGLTDSSGGDSP